MKWSHPSDLNRRPFDYESNALPTELGWRLGVVNEMNRIVGPVVFREPNFKIYLPEYGRVKRVGCLPERAERRDGQRRKLPRGAYNQGSPLHQDERASWLNSALLFITIR